MQDVNRKQMVKHIRNGISGKQPESVFNWLSEWGTLNCQWCFVVRQTVQILKRSVITIVNRKPSVIAHAALSFVQLKAGLVQIACKLQVLLNIFIL